MLLPPLLAAVTPRHGLRLGLSWQLSRFKLESVRSFGQRSGVRQPGWGLFLRGRGVFMCRHTREGKGGHRDKSKLFRVQRNGSCVVTKMPFFIQ